MANSLIPYSFVPGTKAMASEVNANFLALANSVEEGKQYTNSAIENFNKDFEARLDEYDGIVGEKLQPNMSNSLNISNCIIEQPQRVKYTLADGKLTIKAGSVVIVPYGLQDLREQYPVGSTFISEKFKVVDTQFTSKGFFVWAELQEDLVNTSTTSTSSERQPYLYLNGTFGAMVQMESGTASKASANYTVYYNTSTNRIGVATTSTTISYDSVISFPFMRVMGNSSTFWANVLQVFNGMGYIGNTFWLDKGVKALMPNGLNSDGTYNNREYIANELLINTFANTSTWTRNRQPIILYQGALSTNVSSNRYYEAYSDPDPKSSYVTWLNLSNNTMYHAEATGGEYSKIVACFLGYANMQLGKITSFTPRQVVKLADVNEVNRLIQTNKASNGYMRLGDGMLIQWGMSSSFNTDTYQTITFPLAFSSAPKVIAQCQTIVGDVGEVNTFLGRVTTTTFVFKYNRHDGSGSDGGPCNWIAIGY
ncbi:MAG: H-type lectin domain-containing protein [Fusobacterium sp.]|nr:H-type lectin domain-containing protein [Fusobacterium sp.]